MYNTVDVHSSFKSFKVIDISEAIMSGQANYSDMFIVCVPITRLIAGANTDYVLA